MKKTSTRTRRLGFELLPSAVQKAITQGEEITKSKDLKLRPAQLKIMHKIALAWGGECLSDQYLGIQKHLIFRCANGHVWQKKPSLIINGHFCSVCKIGDIRSWRERKFALLPAAVQKAIGKWVPMKTGSKDHASEQQTCLKVIQGIAQAWGGECLSEHYANSYSQLAFRCNQGHVWTMVVEPLLYGSFCALCSKSLARAKTLQNIIETRGIYCLETGYVSTAVRVRWRCRKGHEWTATTGSIKLGVGCGVCDRERRYHTLEHMQSLAASRGGVCLSTHYTNVKTKMEWQCQRGHIWMAKADNLLIGHWCPQCAILSRITVPGSKCRAKYL
ncbi:hypothetical protein R6242_02740 [Iodobacter sp. CM08]|uniref:hypothetical protein n=1 Tax=Iodobacter sp. CM08 TaxID=3085902 RepID=UPI0029817C4C|nr:hypothetical protein [Iodobacter sp. CM08]MDW5415486.1 hypothetical protein [Iodobacter sp. CM08]